MKTLVRLMVWVVLLAGLIAPEADAGRLVGHWTFDYYQGTDPLANKVPDVRWEPISLLGPGATASQGRLILPRYQLSGTWKQSAATTLLRTDLGAGGYFKEMTQVVWLKWPGFDTPATWQRLTNLIKLSSSNYNIDSLTNTRANQSISLKTTDTTGWTGQRSYEYMNAGVLAFAAQWATHGGIDPPSDRCVKIAQVLRQVDAANYEQLMYWDTGNGLVPIGGGILIPAANVNAFGQFDTDCLVDSSGGKRYDGFGVMDYSWSVPQSAGDIHFEEIRLYSGALSTAEIEALNYQTCNTEPIERGQWWDELPRALATSNVQEALDYSANMVMNKVAEDPGWGLWFASVYSSVDNSLRQAFENAGLRSIGYRECFGDTYESIAEINYGQPSTLLHHHWNWQAYGGGTIKWAGAWTWFDDADFARPYTRNHPLYGGPAMTYPDGTPATGFVDDDPTDPRKCRVYRAGSAMNIMGAVDVQSYEYNATVNANGGPFDGLLYVPETGKYSGLLMISKDSACPYWDDYAFATTRMTVDEVGEHGSWTDNCSIFNSFGLQPTKSAFGEWSVALFRTYLRDHFTEAQLRSWGVIGPTGTYANLATFDVRLFLRNLAVSKYGWNGTNINANAWKNVGWLNEPVWRAYKIFKRQVGTQAIWDYCNAAKQGAAMAGQPEYLILGNDPALVTLGWLRGAVDMSTTELYLGWHPSAGSRGFGLPPAARLSPTYKATHEQSKSRFLQLMLYNNGGYEDELAVDEIVNIIYYEMLATHTMPKFMPADTSFGYAGNPRVDKAFFKFVKEQATPEFGAREPVQDVGIFCSSSSILAQYTPGGVYNFDAQPHHFSVYGWGTAMVELHYQHRMVMEWKLTRDLLRTLKVLIIPHSSVFDPVDVDLLEEWVRDDGGILIVTGDSGSLLPESGNFDSSSSLLLAPLTGVGNWSTAPASSTRILGNGRVRFIKNNIGLSYFLATDAGRVGMLQTFADEMSALLDSENEHVALTSADAPRTVGLTLYDDPAAGKLIVDVNNFNCTIAPDGLSATVTRTPLINVTIYKPDWWDDYACDGVLAYAISPSGPVIIGQPVVYGDRIEIRVPPTTYYTSVIMLPVVGMGSVKSIQPGGRAVLDSQVVTAVFDDCFYVESPDRSCGIRVDWNGGGVVVGRRAYVAGSVDVTADGELFIRADSVADRGEGTVDPIAMSTKSLGGGDFHYVPGNPPSGQRGVEQGEGLNNIGLLVKTFGTVTGVGDGFFFLDDGGGVVDASGFAGVAVRCDGLRTPVVGAFAVVTGISTLYSANGSAYRLVRARSQSDIEVPVSASLIGRWDFDGAEPLSNKASGVMWDPLTVSGTGAGVSNGALVLPRYQSGSTWYQAGATTMLKTDLGSDGYFDEMTQVAWVYWPGFNTSHFGRVFGMFKLSSSSYSTSGSKAAQALVWGSYSNQKWRGYRAWEYLSGGAVASSSAYYDFVVPMNPPSDSYIKIAQVLRRLDENTYELKLYCDTGTEVAQIGNTVSIPSGNVNAFGQYNTDCLIDPSGGKRYDWFGIMDATYRVPTTPGSIYFDEIRLYGGALSAAQIDAL